MKAFVNCVRMISSPVVTRWHRPINGSPVTKLLPSFVEPNRRTKKTIKLKKRSPSTFELIWRACRVMNHNKRYQMTETQALSCFIS